jgi:superfamily II DNA or RNA helicase/HKD family nuclease
MSTPPSPFEPGLYETPITRAVHDALQHVRPELIDASDLASAEAPDRIALHLARQIERALRSVGENQRIAIGRDLVGFVLDQIARTTSVDLGDTAFVDPVQVLRAINRTHPDGTVLRTDPPLIPLLDTTLLTNAPGEPRVGHQIAAEIESAQQIDVLMAFIRKSGISPLLPKIRRHVDGGGRVRVLTTTYTGSTQREALELLTTAGADVKVSYDTSSTRLHAKAWIFHRASGFSTAYIGSSNLTNQAQVTGLEWNVRASGARNPDVIDKMRAVFESYWQSADFEPFDPADFDRRTATTNTGPAIILSPVGVTPLAFQQRLLEQLEASRVRGFHRNLLVSATGTGKTVMAALDYASLATLLPRARLLFVAHRKEILDQSQAVFRHTLRDPSFGEQWVAGQRPGNFEHVFASVQTLANVRLDDLDPHHFDVVVIDEFHHAAAQSYERLLAHLEPAELLGLTATPERADGLPILHWFGDRIAAELRLWDAIDQGYLATFAYYGIFDGLDLRDVPWRRGVGYDVEGLTNLYTAHDRWAQFVVKEFVDRVDDVSSASALGFCVSVDHARYMARVFNEAGIAAEVVWADTPADERRSALQRLGRRETNVVFSVDLFNEGVDVPVVDTLLFLRPTESPTLFLQQLGRGLRRSPGKQMCTVLDFVGLHRREFRFDLKLRALLGGTRRDVEQQVAADFPFLPAGCHMQLDEQSREVVLHNIRSAVPSNATQRVAELRAMRDAGHEVTLRNFLAHSGLELDDVYSGAHCWSSLREAAGYAPAPAGPHEDVLRRATTRLLHIDDAFRLDAFGALLANDTAPEIAAMPEPQQRMARMLAAPLLDSIPGHALAKSASLQDGFDLLWRHPQVLDELRELFTELRDGLDQVDHVHRPIPGRPDSPLRVHARYTRLEILAAFGHGTGATVTAWQSGVFWLPEERADLFAFTLDKSSGSFSPTTRYRDYAISRELIHWESQSATRADSPTGQRYQQHADSGSDVFLFARLRQDDRAFWCLGPANYVRHEGERPMAITWRLHVPLPGDLYTSFAVAVA